MWKRLVVCLSLFLLSCTEFNELFRRDKPEDDRKDTIMYLLLLNYLGTVGTTQAYMARAQYGLASWNINLDTQAIAYDRNTSAVVRLSNPANWITISGADCDAVGVPSTVVASCPFSNPSTIGVCYQRVSSAGVFFDTTLIMRQSFQDDPAYSESMKRAVFIHEVGHCLGLKHSASITDIMYPSLTGTVVTPSAGELSSVAEVYGSGTPATPSVSTGDTYYTVHSGQYVRHSSFPLFSLSVRMGSQNTTPGVETEGNLLGEVPTDITSTISISGDSVNCEVR